MCVRHNVPQRFSERLFFGKYRISITLSAPVDSHKPSIRSYVKDRISGQKRRQFALEMTEVFRKEAIHSMSANSITLYTNHEPRAAEFISEVRDRVAYVSHFTIDEFVTMMRDQEAVIRDSFYHGKYRYKFSVDCAETVKEFLARSYDATRMGQCYRWDIRNKADSRSGGYLYVTTPEEASLAKLALSSKIIETRRVVLRNSIGTK